MTEIDVVEPQVAAPRVFISYVHVDGGENYRDRVLALTNHLRAYGVDCELDQFHETIPPAQGWARWMIDEIEAARYILVVCTETYYRRFRAREQSGGGLGAIWEGGVITQALYESAGQNEKFIPIGFADHRTIAASIPDPLRSTTYRNVDTSDGFESLLRQLHASPAIVKPPLGQRPDFSLPASVSPDRSVPFA